MNRFISFFKEKFHGKKFSKVVITIVLALGIMAGITFFIMPSNAAPNNQSLSKDYFDSEIEFLTSLAASASYFKQTAVTDYAKAIITISTEQGMEALHHIDTAIWKATQSQIGWALFFNSAVTVYTGGDVKTPVVGYYNPYNDIFLVTVWSEDEGIYKIADAELLMGDFIRNENEALDVIPFWLRGEMHRPEAIGRSVALSLLAFEKIFNETTLDEWRKGLPLLTDQDGLNNINYSLAALRLNEHLINITSFSYTKTNNRQLESCKAATIETINIASNGNIDKILDTADGTSQTTAKRLKEISPKWFATLRVGAVLTNSKGGLVLLSPAQQTKGSLTISFKETSSKLQVKRIDLVDYQYFYEQIRSLQGTNSEGGVK